eukprot:SAG22_NODE_288_length_12949_cov_163.316265_17_plen_99_part_00
MRAARVSKGFNQVAKKKMLGEAEGKLKHIVNYYQKRKSQSVHSCVCWPGGSGQAADREHKKANSRGARTIPPGAGVGGNGGRGPDAAARQRRRAHAPS